MFIRRQITWPLIAASVIVAACSPKFDWREVRSPADAYAVSLPGKPLVVTRDVELPLATGARTVSVTMTSAGVGPTLFAVGVAHLPEGVPQDGAAVLASMAFFRDGLLRNIGVQSAEKESMPAPDRLPSPGVRASTAFEARGKLARTGEAPEPARLAARIYVVDDRLYQIVAMGRAGDLPDNEIDTFFLSFHLTSP